MAGIGPKRSLSQLISQARRYMVSQESLESDILSWIAKHTSDEAIRAQCQTAEVVSREFTGVGSYSKIKARNIAGKSSRELADAGPLIESTELPLGGAAVLWLKDGVIDLLEIVLNGEYKYPEDIKEYKLFDFKG